MFVDQAEIRVCGGRGGDGSSSLRREKFVPKGGPDGGDGGRGGDVVLVADPAVSSLQLFEHSRSFKAAAGAAGEPANRHGADGKSITLRVPVGTVVTDAETERLLADLDRPGSQVVVAEGGRGGRGNVHFASPVRQAPRRRELGASGQLRMVQLELRLIAEVGLVGLPNAGKSSLLARLTGAHPKIGDYPFTTLAPNLGVVQAEDGTRLTIADVPGLVEGAHHGAGLGLAFLRHLRRTQFLIQVVDGSQGVASAVEAFRAVSEELTRYGRGLEAKPALLAVNKSDLLPEAELRLVVEALAREVPDLQVLAVSALTGAGCDRLQEALATARLAPRKERPEEAKSQDFRLYRGPRAVGRSWSVERSDHGFSIIGEALERLVSTADLDDESSLMQLQRRLRRMGVEEALVRAGVAAGDEVTIGQVSFDYYPDDYPLPRGDD